MKEKDYDNFYICKDECVAKCICRKCLRNSRCSPGGKYCSILTICLYFEDIITQMKEGKFKC